MKRVLKPGGRLYVSVPTGKERVEFNSQRVFHPDTIPNLLGMALVSRETIEGKHTLYEFTK